MKVIDTFLWSEPHEANCLEIHLNCEADVVDEWIIVQSDYTFRGQYKGCSLEKVLAEDRFLKFTDRIRIVSIKENLFQQLCTGHDEKNYFLVEFASRAAAWDYILGYDDSTRVIVGDVDEVIDFSDPVRRDRFFQLCKTGDPIQLAQLKMWWDIDNYSTYPKYIPVHTVGSLRSGRTSFTHRNNDCQMINDGPVLAMEYAYSFSLEDNFRKCCTFAHDRYTKECIDEALYFNTWHKCRERGETLGQIWDWFETIELTPDNSPLYVRDNYDRFKVGTVNANYAECRKNAFGLAYPHPAEQHGLLRGNKIRRDCHYYKKGN